jgi:hypothetical protein
VADGERTMTGRAKQAQCTLKFKLEAMRLVNVGENAEAVATLGRARQPRVISDFSSQTARGDGGLPLGTRAADMAT